MRFVNSARVEQLFTITKIITLSVIQRMMEHPAGLVDVYTPGRQVVQMILTMLDFASALNTIFRVLRLRKCQ